MVRRDRPSRPTSFRSFRAVSATRLRSRGARRSVLTLDSLTALRALSEPRELNSVKERWIMSRASDAVIDVVIVGAGPTGLALGVDLARRGVDALVVEKADGLFPGSRGK